MLGASVPSSPVWGGRREVDGCLRGPTLTKDIKFRILTLSQNEIMRLRDGHQGDTG